MLSSKNIYQTSDLIDLIDASLVKVIAFKLRKVFIVFYLIFLSLLQSIIISIITSLLLSSIISIITRSSEYAILLFCLLIVQKDLTILFIFDDLNLNQYRWTVGVFNNRKLSLKENVWSILMKKDFENSSTWNSDNPNCTFSKICNLS